MTRGKTELNTLVLNLAFAQLNRLMKDYLEQESNFTVCCVLSDSSIEASFIVAANRIFDIDPPAADDWAAVSQFVIVPSTSGRNRSLALYRSLNECYRCILLYAEVEAIPDAVLDGADAVIEIGKFTKDDMNDAFQRFLGHQLTDADASSLANVSSEVLDFSFRKMVSFSDGLARVRAIEKARVLRLAAAEAKAISRSSVSPASIVSLDDIVGYGEAKRWALRLRDEINRVKKGEIGAESLDRGAILCGPPGTGKTHFAKLVAEECKIPFIEASYADWQRAGHMGEQLQAMDKTFAEASYTTPCILLIDELDSFSNRDDRSSDYSDKVVNALLQKLDGPSRKPGVIIIGTTNNLDKIDPAVRRPGRFSDIFNLELPTDQERLAIAEQYLSAPVPEDVIVEFLTATNDFSGDGIKHLIRKVLRSIRTKPSQNLSTAIIDQLPRFIRLSDQRLYSIAVHECGHAIAALRSGIEIELVMIADKVRHDTTGSAIGGRLVSKEGRLDRITAADILNKIAVCLGGLVAESILLGSHEAGVGGSDTSDLPRATDFATMYEACLGMGRSTSAEVLNSSRELRLFRQNNPTIRMRVDQLLTQEKKRVEQMLFADRALIDALARELVVRKRMTGAEIEDFAEKFSVQNDANIWPAPYRRVTI